jgi:hypothetical protein
MIAFRNAFLIIHRQDFIMMEQIGWDVETFFRKLSVVHTPVGGRPDRALVALQVLKFIKLREAGKQRSLLPGGRAANFFVLLKRSKPGYLFILIEKITDSVG